MAKRKKDAISKKPGEAEKKPARFKATAEQARTRTASVKEKFATMGKLWWQLGAEVKACIDDYVPEALGKNATEWMKECFGDAWLKVYRAHRAVAALPGVAEKTLEKISEGNAYQLARLPKPERKKPEWINRAIALPNEKFRDAVDKLREKKGVKRDPMVKWRDIFGIVSVPKTLAELMKHALELAGKQEQQDMDTKEGRINAIELIFADFVTGLTGAPVAQEEQRGSTEGELEPEPEPEPEPGQEGEIQQQADTEYSNQATEPVEQEQSVEQPKRRRKASAA